MNANCGNCFWWKNPKAENDYMIGSCVHIDNLYRDTNHNCCNRTTDNVVCSNWQAKDTKSMVCENCRYQEKITGNFFGEEIKSETRLIRVDGCGVGCVKFWPKGES